MDALVVPARMRVTRPFMGDREIVEFRGPDGDRLRIGTPPARSGARPPALEVETARLL
ncbi:hypothetical protein [Streptosporangium sp. NPDC051022]|uniref:hypothetical protein n=1 Tax=Streptosporangium sp. NPDC051022 TaxID=3155752 RepID=UPI00343BEB52